MKQRILFFAILGLAAFAAACSGDDDKKTPGGEPDKTYAIGDFYSVNGVKGVVYKLDDQTGAHGLIVSLDETSTEWATAANVNERTGATNHQDGMKNMAVIEAIDGWQTKFPAFAWCEAKNKNGVTGWFLPAFEQLIKLCEVYAADPAAFNASLTTNEGTAVIPDSSWWSSSENLVADKVDEAAQVNFGNKSYGFQQKQEPNYVRAVRAF